MKGEENLQRWYCKLFGGQVLASTGSVKVSEFNYCYLLFVYLYLELSLVL